VKKILLKIEALLIALVMIVCLTSCAASEKEVSQPAAAGSYDTFKFTHYASGGNEEEYEAVILFEQSNSTFTAYQVAYSSCTCRNALVNYYMVCYVEILNTKKSPEFATIRDITCLDNKGVWGDSNPNYYIAEYTEEYMNEHLTKGFIGATKQDIDSFKGYGTWIDYLEADAIAGATVSSSNMQSMLKSLMEYHVGKYY